MLKPAVLCAVLPVLALLSGCSDDDSSPVMDTDASPDQVDESSLPGAAVGITVAVPKYAGRPVTFSLADNAGGTFAIDPKTGVVTLAGHVDFEKARSETFIAQASVASGPRKLKFKQRFDVQVLDSPAPMIEIAFPLAHANISDGAISITGSIDHPHVSNVSIVARIENGTAVPVIDGNRFHFDSIPLGPSQTLVAEIVTSHPGGESGSTFVTVGRQPDLSYVERIVLDSTHDRILMSDEFSGALVAVNRDNGMRTLLSGMNVGSGPSIRRPKTIALDALKERAYVVDTESHELFSIELKSGKREVVSSLERGSGPMFFNVSDMVFDPARSVIFLSDDGQKAVLAVDPVTGTRSFASGGQTSGSRIDFYRGLALDEARDRLILSDGASIFGFDIATGVANVIHDWNSNQISTFLTGMSEVDSSGRVCVADDFRNGVARIDLSNGARTMVTSSGLATTDPQPAIGVGPTLEAPTDVAYDEARDRVYVMEADFGDKLVEVNPNGERRTLADASVGVGINFRGLRGLDFDASTRTIYAVDYVADIIVSIDATNGNRNLISGPVDGRGTIDQSPLDVALDKSRGVVYVADFQTDSVYALNIETGQRVVVADAATGVGPTLYRPQSLRIDAERGVVYVLNLDSTVISVDVATGARSRIGDDSLGQVSGIALDAEKGVLYTAEENSGAIKRVDLATGVVSTVSAGVPFFSSVGAIALDRAQNRILMIEDYPLRLSSVDIATGSRSIVSGEVGLTKAPARGNGTPLGGPSEIEIDEERHIAYISDDQYDAIFAIDLDSGDRQIISK